MSRSKIRSAVYSENDFEEFSKFLYLDPDTGKIFWKQNRGMRGRIGKEAGCVADNGYRIIQIFGMRFKTHRIVWLLYYGSWPVQEIDHINRNKLDNRPVNLRDVCKGDNLVNNPYPNGKTKSEIRGVYQNAKGYSSWQAQLRGKSLGWFPTKEQAAEARRKALENEKS